MTGGSITSYQKGTTKPLPFAGIRPEYAPAFGRKSGRLDLWLTAEDIVLTMFFNFGLLKPGQFPGPMSKYFQAWVTVNQGLPRRGERMSPDTFLEPGLLYTVLVKNGDKDHTGEPKPEYALYSRVEKIVEVIRP